MRGVCLERQPFGAVGLHNHIVSGVREHGKGKCRRGQLALSGRRAHADHAVKRKCAADLFDVIRHQKRNARKRQNVCGSRQNHRSG